MSASLWKTSTSNAFSTTLNGTIAAGDTSITLTSVTGLQFPGVLVIDRVDSAGTATPTNREFISFTGISASQLTGVTRGIGGSTAQSHLSGAVVEETFSVTHWGDMLDYLAVSHNSAGQIVSSAATITTLNVVNQINASGASTVGFNLSSGTKALLGSDATGDIYYNAGSNALARLAIGAATTFLKGGTTPSYGFAFSNYKVISGTRSMTAATGDVTYTGCGFTPKLLIAFGGFTGSVGKQFAIGFTDGTTQKCLSADENGEMTFSNGILVGWETYPNENQGAAFSSFNSDGFVFTWTKTADAPDTAIDFEFAVLALG